MNAEIPQEPGARDLTADSVDDRRDTADDVSWEARIAGVAYGIQFSSELSESVAQELAVQIRSGRGFDPHPDLFVRAIELSRAYSGPLVGVSRRQTQEEFRHFLDLLHAELTKALKPGRVFPDPARVAMKSAALLSNDQDFFAKASEYLVELGGDGGPAAARLDPAPGVHFLLEDDAGDLQWDVEDPPFEPAPGAEHVTLAELKAMHTARAECRYEGPFRDVVEGIASRLSEPLWVLDSDGVLWPAMHIDIEKLLL